MPRPEGASTRSIPDSPRNISRGRSGSWPRWPGFRRNVRRRVQEKDLTLDVAQRIDRLLQAQGIATLMTRTGDTLSRSPTAPDYEPGSRLHFCEHSFQRREQAGFQRSGNLLRRTTVPCQGFVARFLAPFSFNTRGYSSQISRAKVWPGLFSNRWSRKRTQADRGRKATASFSVIANVTTPRGAGGGRLS